MLFNVNKFVYRYDIVFEMPTIEKNSIHGLRMPWQQKLQPENNRLFKNKINT